MDQTLEIKPVKTSLNRQLIFPFTIILAVVFLFAASVLSRAAEEVEADAQPVAADTTHNYKIMVRAAAVAKLKPTKKGPKPWDILKGKPDPYVIVEINGKVVYISDVQKDTRAPEWFTAPEYWKATPSTAVKIRLRDGDLKRAAGPAAAGWIALHPAVPYWGAKPINDRILKSDTDDDIGEWSGTLADLIKATGGPNKQADILANPNGRAHLKKGGALDGLTIRLIQRPKDFDVKKPPAASASHLGLTAATIERVHRKLKIPWDVGVKGEQTIPDPYYLIYVNGSPVIAGAVNENAFKVAWSRTLPAVDLRDEDLVTIQILDTDVGTKLAEKGRHAILFSWSLSNDAKKKLFDQLAKASTDDEIFRWSGTWAKLRTGGPSISLEGLAKLGPVKVNLGLAALTLRTKSVDLAKAEPRKIEIDTATVSKKARNGLAWDLGRKGAPDLFIRCYVADAGGGWVKIAESPVLKNQTTATFSLKLNHQRLTVGRRVKVVVYDKDLRSDDYIDAVTFDIPEAEGQFTVSSGFVRALKFTVSK